MHSDKTSGATEQSPHLGPRVPDLGLHHSRLRARACAAPSQAEQNFRVRGPALMLLEHSCKLSAGAHEACNKETCACDKHSAQVMVIKQTHPGTQPPGQETTQSQPPGSPSPQVTAQLSAVVLVTPRHQQHELPLTQFLRDSSLCTGAAVRAMSAGLCPGLSSAGPTVPCGHLGMSGRTEVPILLGLHRGTRL